LCLGNYTVLSDENNANGTDSSKKKSSKSSNDEASSADSISIRAIDTLKVFPSEYHGTVNQFDYPICITRINKSDKYFLNYFSNKDIIHNKSTAYSFDMGFPAQNSYLSFLGGMPRNNEFRFNGRTLVSSRDFYFDANHISTESYQDISILNGSEAAILSGRTSMINFSERLFNTARPYTQMWYSQAGYGIIAAEGLFSQNFHPRGNFTFSFNNIAGDGRYENSETNHWNIRASARWNFSDFTSISITETFNHHFAKLNGGINLAESQNSLNELDAAVFYSSLNRRLFRHDLTISFSTIFDTTATNYFLANLFLTYEENRIRFKRESKFIAIDSSGKNYFDNHFFGINALYRKNIYDYFDLTLGGDARYEMIPETFMQREINSSIIALFAKAKVNLFDNLTFSFGIRNEKYFYDHLLSIGGNLSYKISNNSSFFADLSNTEMPAAAFQPKEIGKELHYLGIIGYNYHTFRAKVYARRIINPFLAEFSIDQTHTIYPNICDCNILDIIGLDIEYSDKLFDLINYEIKASSSYSQLNSNDADLFPFVSGKIRLFYEYQVSQSLFRGGVEGAIFSPFNGFTFEPLSREFIATSSRNKWQGDGLAAFVALRLGNAFVRASFYNLLGQNYYYVNYYPMTSRMFHLSVSWAFGD